MKKTPKADGKYGSAAEPHALREAPAVYKKAGGVVCSIVQVPTENPRKGFTPSELVDVVRAGLPIDELEALRENLGISLDELSPKLGISKATLHRRKAQGRLALEESDRVVRFARLFGKTVEVMESGENARRWLNSPQIGLGGAVPLEYAETEVGAREVEDLLTRIEYGVYS